MEPAFSGMEAPGRSVSRSCRGGHAPAWPSLAGGQAAFVGRQVPHGAIPKDRMCWLRTRLLTGLVAEGCGMLPHEVVHRRLASWKEGGFWQAAWPRGRRHTSAGVSARQSPLKVAVPPEPAPFFRSRAERLSDSVDKSADADRCGHAGRWRAGGTAPSATRPPRANGQRGLTWGCGCLGGWWCSCGSLL